MIIKGAIFYVICGDSPDDGAAVWLRKSEQSGRWWTTHTFNGAYHFETCGEAKRVFRGVSSRNRINLDNLRIEKVETVFMSSAEHPMPDAVQKLAQLAEIEIR